MESDDLEICCSCGRSVARTSPLFVNRVPDLNKPAFRAKNGRKFPLGGWVCVICDNTDSGGVVHQSAFQALSSDEHEKLIREVERSMRRHRCLTLVRWS